MQIGKFAKKYLNRQEDLSRRFSFSSNLKFRNIICIPAYSELAQLPKTLRNFWNQSSNERMTTLAIVCINHSIACPETVKNENQETAKLLQKLELPFPLLIVDAFSDGLEFSTKNKGVGLARKLAMDIALHFSNENSIFFCTDADTLHHPDYLRVVNEFYKNERCGSAVCQFSHQTHPDKSINLAIQQYEKFLKITAEKLQECGSPYAYVSLGSAITCTANEYVRSGGMSKKAAAEDFYFLERLSKVGMVHTIPKVLVYPSARVSDRVYLGTGFRMGQVQAGFHIDSLYFSAHAFEMLKNFIAVGTSAYQKDFDMFCNELMMIHPEFGVLLMLFSAEKSWAGLQKSAKDSTHFREQFHRWFDALKTIKFLKFFN